MFQLILIPIVSVFDFILLYHPYNFKYLEHPYCIII